MSGIDYKFVQDLVNFGRGLAGEMVGQPFRVYRLNEQSQGDVLAATNIIIPEIRAKVTHNRPVTQMENEYMHSNAFNFLLDNASLQVGDLLEQTDDLGANSYYAVASMRPLKATMCIRVESICRIERPTAQEGRYAGPTRGTNKPFTVIDGVFTLGGSADKASLLPCGLQNIGQLKNQKPEHLPMDTITSWWFIYVPHMPGLFSRLRENDTVTVLRAHPDENDQKFRVHIAYKSDVGTAGNYLVCEKL